MRGNPKGEEGKMISLLIQCVVRLSLLAGEIIKASVELAGGAEGRPKAGNLGVGFCLVDKINSIQQRKQFQSYRCHL